MFTDRHQVPIDLPQQRFILLGRQLNDLPIHSLEGLHGCVRIVGMFQDLLVQLLHRAT